jgi:hypothetical protein
VLVFKSWKETPGAIKGYGTAVVLPFKYIEMPVAPIKMLVVPKFTIVISVPIGKATAAFVGIVIVCAPLLAE